MKKILITLLIFVSSSSLAQNKQEIWTLTAEEESLVVSSLTACEQRYKIRGLSPRQAGDLEIYNKCNEKSKVIPIRYTKNWINSSQQIIPLTNMLKKEFNIFSSGFGKDHDYSKDFKGLAYELKIDMGLKQPKLCLFTDKEFTHVGFHFFGQYNYIKSSKLYCEYQLYKYIQKDFFK